MTQNLKKMKRLKKSGSQRKILINKIQEVWVNNEFEDDLDNSQSVKQKCQIVLIKLKKSK